MEAHDPSRAILLCQIFCIMTIGVVTLIGSLLDERQHLYQLALVNAQISHKLREKELEAIAWTDALTGLANRRRLNEIYRQEWSRNLRQKTPLSLLIVDIDYFKNYNDTYNHARGDRCLATVAAVIRETLKRPTDFCARYGGEEFVALLSDTPCAGAGQIADKICKAVRARNIPHAGSDLGAVTVSIGVATLTPASADNGVLFESADALLYLAKRQGRNRYESIDLNQTGVPRPSRDASATAGIH